MIEVPPGGASEAISRGQPNGTGVATARNPPSVQDEHQRVLRLLVVAVTVHRIIQTAVFLGVELRSPQEELVLFSRNGENLGVDVEVPEDLPAARRRRIKRDAR